MVKRVIESIAKSIWQKSDKKLNVYTEKISQGLKMPCAFVECKKVERVPLLNDRYFLRIHSQVTVETRSEKGLSETDTFLKDLFFAMGWIEIDKIKIQGRGINAKRENGKLLLSAMYDVFIKDDDKKDLMKSLSVNRSD